MNDKSRTVNLSEFSPTDFDKGAAKFKIVLWYFVNVLFVIPSWNPVRGVKIALLRFFGAKIGKGVVIKNKVNIPLLILFSPSSPSYDLYVNFEERGKHLKNLIFYHFVPLIYTPF